MENSYKEWRTFVIQDVILIGVVILLASFAILLRFDSFVILVSAMHIIIILLLLIGLYTFNLLNNRRTIKKITGGDLWVRWFYTTEEWNNFVNNSQLREKNAQQAKVWQSELIKNAIIISIFFLIIAGFGLWREGWQGLIGILMVGLVSFGLFYRSNLRIKRGLANPYPQANRVKPEVHISSQGVIYSEKAFLFTQPRVRITNAMVELNQPSKLCISLEYAMQGKRIIPYDFMLPIPIGHDAEAYSVINHLQSKYINS